MINKDKTIYKKVDHATPVLFPGKTKWGKYIDDTIPALSLPHSFGKAEMSALPAAGHNYRFRISVPERYG